MTYTDYYNEKLQEGLEFQDIVTKALYSMGIIVVGYASRCFQAKYGENMLGAEIKRDGRFRDTGNIYIEIKEKAHPGNDEYVDSGIYREDNSWLYIIGDEKKAWIFSIKYLRWLHKSKPYQAMKIPTSCGFLMPLDEVEKYSLMSFTPVTNGRT